MPAGRTRTWAGPVHPGDPRPGLPEDIKRLRALLKLAADPEAEFTQIRKRKPYTVPGKQVRADALDVQNLRNGFVSDLGHAAVEVLGPILDALEATLEK